MTHVVSKEHLFWLYLIGKGELDWEDSFIGNGGHGRTITKNLAKVMLFGIPDHRGEAELAKKILQARVKVFFHRSGYSPEKVVELLENDFRGLSNPPPQPDEAEIAVAQKHVDMVIRQIQVSA